MSLSAESVSTFLQDYFQGKVEAYYKGEAEGERQDPKKEVVRIVRSNLKKYGEKQHMMVLAYAPWCQHCEKALEMFGRLSEIYRRNVVFGKMDGTLNEVGAFEVYSIRWKDGMWRSSRVCGCSRRTGASWTSAESGATRSCKCSWGRTSSDRSRICDDYDYDYILTIQKIEMNSKQDKKSKTSFQCGGQTFTVDAKYEYIKQVGHGAYGVVCSALNKKTNQKVAIKKVRHSLSHSRCRTPSTTSSTARGSCARSSC